MQNDEFSTLLTLIELQAIGKYQVSVYMHIMSPEQLISLSELTSTIAYYSN